MINILSAHIQELLFVILCIILIFSGMRFFSPRLMPFSFRTLAISLSLVWGAYGLILTFIQRSIWALDPSMKTFLTLPLDKAVPLSWWLEWVRGPFEHAGGAFAFYSLGHFFLPIILALLFAAIVYFLFFIIARWFPGHLLRDDVILIFITVLLPGWPKVLFVVPLAFIILLPLTLFTTLRKQQTPHWFLGAAFLVAALLLFLGEPVLKNFHLYTFLKI